MESKTKNRKTREQIARMAERAFGGISLAQGEDAIHEFTEGWFNVVYQVRLADGREVILKIAPPPDADVLTYEQNIMDTEVASMRRLRENPAIPVPEIYFYDCARDLCNSNYFFMEKLSGDNYEHIKKDLPEAACAQIERQIGAIVHEVNRYTGPYFGYDGNPGLRAVTWKEAFFKMCVSVLEDGRRVSAEYGFSPEEIRAAIQNHAPALEEVTLPVMVHWDAWDLNIFVKNSKVCGIIDFERVFWGDPLMEAQFRKLAWESEPECLKGYGKTTFTPAEDVRNTLYTLHLALVMKTESYYRHYDTDSIANMGLRMIGQTMQWLKEH